MLARLSQVSRIFLITVENLGRKDLATNAVQLTSTLLVNVESLVPPTADSDKTTESSIGSHFARNRSS